MLDRLAVRGLMITVPNGENAEGVRSSGVM
jgi:hypothetical protein